MQKLNNLQQKPNIAETVDNYIILASITLLASFSILITNSKVEGKLISVCILVSILSLIFTLSMCLWHKIRFNLRVTLFENEREKIIESYAKNIADVTEGVVPPYIKSKKAQGVPPSSKEEDPAYKIIYSFCKNLGTDFNEASEKFFSKPLKEKYSKIKFIIDIGARKFRYPAFGIGLLFYFLTILAKYK